MVFFFRRKTNPKQPHPFPASFSLGNTGKVWVILIGLERVGHTAAFSATINLRVFPEADLILSIEQITKTKHLQSKHLGVCCHVWTGASVALIGTFVSITSHFFDPWKIPGYQVKFQAGHWVN